MSSTVEESIEVGVPVRHAYDQWTQFEDFPRFMEGVEAVTQIDDTHLHWVAEIAGRRREFDAVITEQQPDARIAWRTESGAGHAGVVTFHRLGDGRSKVMLQMDYEPDGVAENVADWLGVVRRSVKGDLERFRELVESQEGEGGAWRGAVPQDATR
jgi:uncharacterized membrane protein